MIAAILYAIEPKPAQLELLREADWIGIGSPFRPATDSLLRKLFEKMRSRLNGPPSQAAARPRSQDVPDRACRRDEALHVVGSLALPRWAMRSRLGRSLALPVKGER